MLFKTFLHGAERIAVLVRNRIGTAPVRLYKGGYKVSVGVNDIRYSPNFCALFTVSTSIEFYYCG